MVTYVKGNLLDSPAQVLTNTVNTVGIMGKGIAAQFKKRFPDLFEDYSRRCKGNLVKVGEPYLWENESVQVLNFPTKGHWRSKSKLQEIERGLKHLAEHYQQLGIYSIAIPPLGCGNGGLLWSDVQPLIDRHLASIPDLEAFVYLPHANSQRAATAGRRKRTSSRSGQLPIAARSQMRASD